MGKKRVATQTEEELLKEREKVEKKVGKEGKFSSLRTKEGRVYISSTYNNTSITLADSKGDVISWASAGQIGFKGTKKGTPFAASKVAEAIIQALKKMGIEKIRIIVDGIGAGRDSALRSLAARGLEILSVKDATPLPHNGAKPPKPRRV